MASTPLTFDELLQKIGFPVEEAKKRLEQLASAYPDANPPIQVVENLITNLFSVDNLIALKKLVADELIVLLQTGKSDISQNDDDSGLA